MNCRAQYRVVTVSSPDKNIFKFDNINLKTLRLKIIPLVDKAVNSSHKLILVCHQLNVLLVNRNMLSVNARIFNFSQLLQQLLRFQTNF